MQSFVTFLLLSFFLFPAFLGAQNYQLIKSIPAKGTNITSDYLGAFYTIKDYRFNKYDNNGNLLYTFEDYKNGVITTVDVSDPLKIIVYYEDFMRIKVLDKTLSEMGSYSLSDLDLYSVSCLAHSRDDNFWVFDRASFQLKKVDEDGVVLYRSENFNLLFKEDVEPIQIIDYERNLYLNDPKMGIYIFDRFGTYQKRIPLLGLENIQIIKGLIVFFKDGALLSYNLLTFEEEAMQLPEGIKALSVQLQKDRIYIVEKDKISIYSTK